MAIHRGMTNQMCQVLDDVDRTEKLWRAPSDSRPLGGMKIIQTTSAVKKVGENFKPSKNRSRRVQKKLLKRYGSMSIYEPCAYAVGSTLYVHPAMMAKLKERLKEDNERC